MSKPIAKISKPRIGVKADTADHIAQARAIAAQLQLPLIEESEFKAYDFQLLVQEDYLGLVDNAQPKTKPLLIDFLSAKNLWRQKAGGQELLAKAVGCKGNHKPSIIDTTAGLGRDAFVLANLGCSVLMLERSPIMSFLLQDGLRRLQSVANFVHLRLQQADAQDYLAKLAEADRPEVIYLDPMYPHRSKSALVKKEMRMLRALVGDDQDASSLAELALQKACKRVVIKRPKLAEPLLPKPQIQFSGKTSRFDVYLK